MITHSWIIECLDMFRVGENSKTLLGKSIEIGQVEFCSGDSILGEINISRGMFQGDSLSPLERA